MKRGIVIAVMLTLVGIGVRAQGEADSGKWRLRTPTAEEYLTAMPEVVEKWHEELPPYYGKVSQQPIVDAMGYELQHQYSEATLFSQDFATLSQAYYAGLNASYNNPFPFGNEYQWGMAMLNAWLREHKNEVPNLEKIDTPVISGELQAADFDGDGIAEYALSYSFGALTNFFVLKPDPTLPEGYKVIDAPTPWSECCIYYLTHLTQANE